MCLFGKLLGVLVTVLIGLHVTEAGQQSCATPQKIAEINASVEAFQTVLNDVLSGGGSEMERYGKVFDLACNNATYKTQIDMLAVDIQACLLLVGVTSLPTLTFGPLSFVQLLAKFPTGGFEEFCDCSPYLPAALALEQTQNSYSIVAPNGEYDMVANLPFYCAESFNVGGQVMNIRAMLNMTLMGMDTTCPRSYVLIGMTNKNMAMYVRDFLPTCGDVDAAKFQCAINNSASSEFKTCMTNAVGEKADCSKYDCIKTHISADNKCGPKGGMHYIEAVNIHKGMAELRDSECSGVGSIGMSFTAMLAPLLLLFVL